MSSLGFRENCTRIFGRKGTTFAFPPPPPRAVPGIRIAHEYRQIWSPSRNALALASSFVPWSQYAFVIRKVSTHLDDLPSMKGTFGYTRSLPPLFRGIPPCYWLFSLSLSLSLEYLEYCFVYIYIRICFFVELMADVPAYEDRIINQCFSVARCNRVEFRRGCFGFRW